MFASSICLKNCSFTALSKDIHLIKLEGYDVGDMLNRVFHKYLCLGLCFLLYILLGIAYNMQIYIYLKMTLSWIFRQPIWRMVYTKWTRINIYNSIIARSCCFYVIKPNFRSYKSFEIVLIIIKKPRSTNCKDMLDSLNLLNVYKCINFNMSYYSFISSKQYATALTNWKIIVCAQRLQQHGTSEFDRS